MRKHPIMITIGIYILLQIALLQLIWFLRINKLISWGGISAVGQCSGALITILIPIGAIYIENRLNESQDKIKDSNITLYDEINQLKESIKDIDKNTINGMSNGDIDEVLLKDDIYNYICISIYAKTIDIEKEFNIDFEQAKKILLELSRRDGLIKPASLLDNPESEDCEWTKKR